MKNFRPLSGYLISKLKMKKLVNEIKKDFRPLSGYLISKYAIALLWHGKLYFISVPSRGILFPNQAMTAYMCYLLKISVPSRGILFPNHVEKCRGILGGIYFRPLSGYLISKYCPPEPAILLAFLTLLRGKSFSCIFFLYLNIHNRLQMQYLCGARQNYLFF